MPHLSGIISSLPKQNQKYRSIHIYTSKCVLVISQQQSFPCYSNKTKNRDQSIYVPANAYVRVIFQQKPISFHSIEQKKKFDPSIYVPANVCASSLSKIHLLHFQKAKNCIHSYMYQQTRTHFLSAKSISFHSLKKKPKYRDQSIYVLANAYVHVIFQQKSISFHSLEQNKKLDPSIYVPANTNVCIISQQKNILFPSLH